jgi:hypothetical protein
MVFMGIASVHLVDRAGIMVEQAHDLLHTQLLDACGVIASCVRLRAITPSWRTKQRRIFVSGKGRGERPLYGMKLTVSPISNGG